MLVGGLVSCVALLAASWPYMSRMLGNSAGDVSQYLTDVAEVKPFRLTVRERGTIDSLKSANIYECH